MPAKSLFVSQTKPHFFRIFFPEYNCSELKIPVSFIKHINSKKHDMVSLIGPSRSVWSVELVTDDDGMSFRNGWPEFVFDHSLNERELLLFRYDGNLHFSVKIFDGSACEKEKAFHASSCQDLAIIGDSQTLKKSLVSVVEDLCASPHRDYLQINPEIAGENHLSETEHRCLVKTPVQSDGERSHVANPSSMPYWSKSRDFDGCKKMDDLSKPTHSQSSHRKRGRPRKSEISKELIQVNLPTVEGIVSVSDDEAVVLGQEVTIKEEPVEFIELPSLQQISCLHDNETDEEIPDEPPKKKSLNSNKRTTTNSFQLDKKPKKKRHSTGSANVQVTVRTKIGKLVSNRRPVTSDEVRKAYETARSFTSAHPSVLVVMRESYVYRGFYLNLPATFVRDHLPNYSRELTLWSPSGEPWTVNYITSNGYGGLSARWSAFSIAHNLEENDVCVFELFRENDMRVHIYRVVEEITPLTNIPA